jgi:hypothetical protein
MSQKAIIAGLADLSIPANEHKVRQLLNRWVAEGLLEPPRTGTNGNTKLYRLNEAGVANKYE